MTGFIIAAVVVGAIGIALGIFLTYSSKKFEVPVDERKRKLERLFREVTVVRVDSLVCDSAAAAIVKGEAP